MKILRWLISVALVFASLPLIFMGVLSVLYVAPTTKLLDANDVARINAASQFVEQHKLQFGQLPSSNEFELWAKHAPEELSLDGVGFSYEPSSTPAQPSYAFTFWDGETTLKWHPELDTPFIAEILKCNCFIFGSKVLDVFVFLGFGLVALLGAWLVAPKPLKTNE